MEYNTIQEDFNEKQLLKTLKTALATSRKSLMEDGLLLIIWGMVFSLGFAWNYYNSIELVPSRIRDIMLIIKPLTGLLLIAYTIYYVFFRRKRATPHTAISTRFVWLGVIIAHNLNVIVSQRIIGEVNFELLHPLQMTLIGFALFVTGGIYRYYILCVGGTIMWLAAALAATYDLNTQYLIRGIADFLSFVLPGILMYLKVKRGNYV